MKNLQRGCESLLVALLIGILTSLTGAPIYAHGGGTPRLTNVPVGPYHLYAWSDPDPWRVGQVHLSLAVTIPNPDKSSSQVELPVTDVDITVTYTPMINNVVDTTATPIVVKAVNQEFLNNFYYDADPMLNREGEWQINIEVNGTEGSGSTQLTMETLPARTLDWTLVVIAGVILVLTIVLIALWSRSQQPTEPTHRSHRGVRRVQRQSGKPAVRKEA
jgi:hypothetical protein